MKIKNLSKFILDFMEDNKQSGFEELKDKLNSKPTQIVLKKILQKNMKPIKDLNKPKRGKSSYLYFCDEHRQSVKEEFPNYNNKEVVTELGLKWNKFKKDNQSDVEIYENKAKEARELYMNEMKKYKDKQGENEIDDEIEDEIDNKKIDNKKIKNKKPKSTEDKKKYKDTKTLILDSKTEINKFTEDKILDKKDINNKNIEDPNLTAFEKFSKKKWSKILEDKPEIEEKEILKILKKKWSKLPEERKQKYFV